MNGVQDVVIVGGGAAGCAAAYYLGLSGIRSTIIEGTALASQASGFAAGSLDPLEGDGIPGPLAALAEESFRMHQRLPEELGNGPAGGYHFRIASQLRVAFDEAEIPDLQEMVDTYSPRADIGFHAEILDAGGIRHLEPRLSSKAIMGIHTRGVLSLDSYAFTLALSEAAGKLGAATVQATVRGLELSGGRAHKVLLEDGEISCGAIVLAMGPWARKAESWLDAYIPVDPMKGEILRIRPPGAPLTLDLFGGGASLYAKPDGLVWCGTTMEWRGFDLKPLDSTREHLWRNAASLAPDLERGKLEEHTACLRPVTPDRLPIIGKLPGYDNVVLVTGAGKKGILLAPGMGKAAAEIVATGSTKVPVSELGPERFSQLGSSD